MVLGLFDISVPFLTHFVHSVDRERRTKSSSKLLPKKKFRTKNKTNYSHRANRDFVRTSTLPAFILHGKDYSILRSAACGD